MSPSPAAGRTGVIALPVQRHRNHHAGMRADHVNHAIGHVMDHVSEEWPVALVFNGIAHTVMMCTPCDLEAFAVGFAISEGIVERNADIQDIEITLHENGATDNNLSNNLPDRIPDNPPNNLTNNLPNSLPGNLPDNPSNNLTNNPLNNPPDDLPDSLPNNLSNNPTNNPLNNPPDGLPYAEIRLVIVQHAFVALKEKRRTLAGRTGCGVCGVESIDLLDLQPARVPNTGFIEKLAPDALARAARELPAHQPLARLTGGLHAAAWCDAQGAILHAFEDVGRHNALDKLIGQRVLMRADLQQGFAFLSSRASYELVRKAARVGIPMIATISAPSSLAIALAKRAGIKLVSFCREAGYVDYETAL